MKLVKSLLLGSAAGLCAVAGAQAADLPARAAAPAVEYVRVCTAYGAGFFYIPGTDTCIRVSGRARGEYSAQISKSGGTQVPNGGVTGPGADLSGTRGLGRLALDARTQTGYGTLRTFVRFDLAYQTGSYLRSGTQERAGTAFVGLGQDTFGRANTQVSVDKAFIQFAGFTAGRATSFFDFYGHDVELIGATSGSDVQSTNLFAYTATFGQGFSATISAEDPLARRQPIFSNQVFNGVVAITSGQTFTQFGGVFTTSVPTQFDALGRPTAVANLDVIQRERLPDFVAALRYDAPWGAAQLSAATHEIFTGKYVNGQTIAYNADGTPTLTTVGFTGAARQPKAEYGYAVQGGLKINLPQIAAGDVLWLQAAYAEGATAYIGNGPSYNGRFAPTSTFTRFSVGTQDAFVNAAGKLKLTEGFSVQAAFLHYWAPQWRSAAFGSYSETYFGTGARISGLGPAVNGVLVGGAGAQAVNNSFNTTLRDYSTATVGANLIWSPVRDLDIGVEALYSRVELLNGRTADLNKNVGNIGSVFNPATGSYSIGTGIPAKLVKSDDIFQTRLRIQRDF